MRVLIFSNEINMTLNFRGDLFKHFADEKKYDVYVACNCFGKTEYSGFPNIKFIDLAFNRASKDIFNNLKLKKKIEKIIKDVKPDLVLNYTIKPIIYASSICKKMGIKNISITTGLGYVFHNNGIVNVFLRHLYRTSIRNANRILFLNEEDKRQFINRFEKYESKAYVMPGEGINLTKYSYQEFEGQNRFLMISRIIKDKGVIEYITAGKEIVDKYSNVTFSLLGEFDEENPTGIKKGEFNDLCNGKIKYLGKTNDIKSILVDHDVVVLPSYNEGMPRTLLEGAACGKVLIASNIRGCNQLVFDNKNGFLCDRGSSKSLVEAIEKYINLTYEDRQKMSQASRKLVEDKFSQEHINSYYDKMINEVMSCK